MSCYIVSQMQIEVIMSYVKKYEKDMGCVFEYGNVKGIKVTRADKNWTSKMADLLYKLNYDSVNCRYNEKTKYPKIKWTIDYDLPMCKPSDLELVVDLLENLMYQSCESKKGVHDPRYQLCKALKLFFLEKHLEQTRTTEVKWGL